MFRRHNLVALTKVYIHSKLRISFIIYYLVKLDY
jgi:hypothetical protein